MNGSEIVDTQQNTSESSVDVYSMTSEQLENTSVETLIAQNQSSQSTVDEGTETTENTETTDIGLTETTETHNEEEIDELNTSKKELTKSQGNIDGVETTNEEDNSDTTTVNYEAEYKKVMKGFKANGVTITPDSIDDVIRLAQKGANYNKKMQEIKPMARIATMLRDNGLFDETKLNEVVNVFSGDPKAIANFLKNQKIDLNTLEIDEEQEEYTPKDYRVSDNEVTFKSTIDELTATPEGIEVLKVISGDETTDQDKHRFSAEPVLLKELHRQSADGVFSQVITEMNRLKVLDDNKVLNAPFIDGYNYAMQKLAHENRLVLPDHVLNNFSTQTTTNSQTPANVTQPNTTTNINKKKAATPPKNSSPSTSPKKKEIDLWSMSEEEMDKTAKSLGFTYY